MGPGRTRSDWTGSERIGPARIGPDRIGPDRIGQARIGPDRTGPDRAGSDRTGTDRTGSDQIGFDRIGPDRIGPDRIGPDRIVVGARSSALRIQSHTSKRCPNNLRIVLGELTAPHPPPKASLDPPTATEMTPAPNIPRPRET